MPTIKDLFADLPAIIPEDAAPIEVDALLDDSRSIRPNSLFIARTGEQTDATTHIPDAAASGAVATLVDESTGPVSAQIPVIRASNLPRVAAAVAERFYANPSATLRCVGVTGTNGKTTIATLTTQILNALQIPTGTIGSISIDTGANTQTASLTTPFPIELSRSLAQMLDNNLRAAIMETSSIALHQHRCSAINFDIAVLTNLTGDHLDYHHTMDEYAACKAMLFEMLDESATAIVNIDDPSWQAIAGNTRAQMLTCSNSTAADCTVAIERTTLEGMTLKMHGPWGTLHASVPLIGAHNAMNVLQSLASAWVITSRERPANRQELESAMASCRAPAGRLEPIVVSDSQDITVLIDFAHTDDALANALGALGRLKPEGASLTALFGCGGDRDPSKRPRMGRIASQLADRVVLTSDNPRSENPPAILDDIAAGIDDLTRIQMQPDRAHAIRETILDASPGDTILIAGKGHETYQLLPNPDGTIRRIDFSDQEHASSALRERLA